ncbi:Uma2 family endonuclease [Thermopolyspora sp. NPDC052614]|uniref:Uma2 family endonuclease n=1 Tax=Thermopolyspora sp. NPDC052614 TaxID=3155682 RepID=UPI00341EA8B7
MAAEAAVAKSTMDHRPYTIHDLLTLDNGYHRFEVLDGTLIMSPAPGYDHQEFGDNLQTLLARRAPKGIKVRTAGNVRLFNSDENGLIPSLVMVREGVSTKGRTWLEADELLCVIEIVSRGSRHLDRVTKPSVYAEAGIPFYWRVELQPFPGQSHGHQVPAILVHESHEGAYRLVESLRGGQTGKIMRPFPVEFDPAELLDEDWPQTWSPE